MRTFFAKFKESLKTRYGKKRAVFFSIIISLSLYLFWGIPLPTKLSSPDIPVSTKLFDRNGKLIYEIYSEKRRSPLDLSEIPDYVKRATIAIEDKDFYKHRGFSFTGIARAIYKISFKRKLEGGSTITQQLVKNALLTPERTIRRKLREFLLTIIVEGIYTKDQILEMYLNQIPYGGTAYGIEAASETYFDKSAKDLNLAEAALIAGLTQAPSKYSPFGSRPELARERQKEVLKQMVETKYITSQEADKAGGEELKFTKTVPPRSPHFALWIKEILAEKYGERMVEQGGLRITTTLDLDLQDFAQQAVASEVAKLKKQRVGNGAAIVTRPKTGEILAMVGSKDYFAEDEDGKVNVILAKRQPGSSIKPINYALAIRDEKITPSTPLADVPTCFIVIGQELYCPKNYDGTFHGVVQARFALGNSYNIPAVRILALNGLENFVEFARSMGLTTLVDPKNYGLSLTLGGGEVRPYDMAVAFGVFANQGIKQDLFPILKIEDYKGKVLEEIDVNKIELSGERILAPEVTYLISHILLDNNARIQAFGPTSFLNVSGHPEVSVKTGTTNDRRDNWTIGYTQYVVVATWVGNNNNTPMGGAVSGVSGASPIWNKIMKMVLDKAEKGNYDKADDGHAWPKQPSDIVGANICGDTGNTSSPNPDGTPTCQTRFEYFMKGLVGARVESGRNDMQIDKTNGQQIGPDTLPENIEVQNHPFILDPLGTLVCTDCPIASSSATIRYPLR
ncbi:MAG: transglycosylase domain-containing protein [Patescibacteria group bacterium]